MPSVRRVVAGHDHSGRSVVLTDEPVPLGGHPAIGFGAAGLWATAPNPSNDGKPQAISRSIPQLGETTFLAVCHPPQARIDSLAPDLHALATASPGDQVPGLVKADTTRHHGMHYSETVDYGVVVSGEVTLILDIGEVTLRAGDTYVLRGSAHAWSNRGAEPAYVAVFLVGAQPCGDRHHV
jgi:quercetin dioxygenase-like cupin family protein